MRAEISGTVFFLLLPSSQAYSFLFPGLPRIYISQAFVSITTLVKVAVTSMVPKPVVSCTSVIIMVLLSSSFSSPQSPPFIQKDFPSVPQIYSYFSIIPFPSPFFFLTDGLFFYNFSHLLKKPPDFEFLFTVPLFCCSTKGRTLVPLFFFFLLAILFPALPGIHFSQTFVSITSEKQLLSRLQ